MLFYLLGSRSCWALQVIIYAGAIMVLFLFVVMMLRADHGERPISAPVLDPGLLVGSSFLRHLHCDFLGPLKPVP